MHWHSVDTTAATNSLSWLHAAHSFAMFGVDEIIRFSSVRVEPNSLRRHRFSRLDPRFGVTF